MNLKVGAAIVVAAIVLFGGIAILPRDRSNSFNIMEGMHATLYKSPTCGCCDNYAAFLRRYGVDVDVINTDAIDSIKEENHVPGSVFSCHTTVYDNYVVEGHVPMEALEELFTQTPDTHGIGMAGMPQGSPGMPGAKTMPFEIFEFKDDSSYRMFMEF